MERVIITIGADGVPQIKVEGVTGRRCTSLTKELESALGGVTERRLTADHSKRAAARQQQRGGGG